MHPNVSCPPVDTHRFLEDPDRSVPSFNAHSASTVTCNVVEKGCATGIEGLTTLAVLSHRL